ncbi:MAG: hypothetical protein AAGA56_27305, partial [Myxococcota bacterium]
ACGGAPAPSQTPADVDTAAPEPPVADAESDAPPALTGPFTTITAMAFGGDGTLFLADSGTGKVHAFQPPPVENGAARAPFNLKNVDAKIAGVLGTTSANVRVRDLAIHPQTKEAYLAVGRVTGKTYASAVVVIDQSGAVRLLDVSATKAVQIPFAPSKEFEFYGEVPGRDLTFTDLEVHEGTLYAAGQSNPDFTSSLWTVPVGLDAAVKTSKVEIYHAVHGQNETRAPIRTMKVVDIGGLDHMVAAYTCTPLVVFPLSAIQDGQTITGKTIAELGYGNTPGDLLAFTAEDMKKNKFPVLFLQNKNQSAQVIPMEAVTAAAGGAGITKPVGLETVSLGAMNVPMTQLLHVDDQDPFHLVAVRRDAEEGDLELVSYLKNVYFRLSDFQSEYEIPGYAYPPEQEPTKKFQNKMKQDEGYPDLVR